MATKNTIKDLRDHLFEVLEGLKDKDEPMDIERSKAVVDVAQAIINTAKVEVDMHRAVGTLRTPTGGFFQLPEEENQPKPRLLTRGQ